jgi:hypothetical protein
MEMDAVKIVKLNMASSAMKKGLLGAERTSNLLLESHQYQILILLQFSFQS